MTQFLKKLWLGSLAAVLAFASTSCNSDDDNGGLPPGTLYDIVTLVSNTDQGSVFEFRRDGDSPLITLTSSRRVSTDFKDGDRLLIAYMPLSGVSYVSGSIDLYGTGNVINGDIQTGTAQEWNSFRTADQNVAFINRSGEYLNVRTEIYVRSQPKTYALVVDESTLDEEIPTAYIIFEPDTQGDTSLHTGYASWNLSKVWNLESVKGLKIVWSDGATGKTGERTFKKDIQQIEPVG